MKSNLNIENDIASRAGMKAVNASEKARKNISNQMKNEDTKQATLDFIFGGNPDAVSPITR